ncbi:HSF-type DNA-binding-domain-containing protein [Spinellus fusiger]|nr:HSF-type DNA-binding-domain-containing protein [Spinellus fusiger]
MLPSTSKSSNSTLSFGTFGPTPNQPTTQKTVPAFLDKLYNMVEDNSTNSLIRWSTDGTSFIVEQHEKFAKTVLPRFYKHNTFASFVRQLNMYDFHKVPHLQQGVLISDSENEIWEFSHPHFQKERLDLLALVIRKRSRERNTEEEDGVNVATLVKDIDAIKKTQTTISSDIHTLHSDNEILWKETLLSREKQHQHQDAIEKILHFLTTVFSNDKAINDTCKQKYYEKESMSVPVFGVVLSLFLQ